MGRNWIKEKMMLLLIFVALASANICSSGQRGYSDTKCKIMKNGEESYCARFQDRPVWYKNLNLVHRKSLDIRVDLEMVAKVVNGRHAAGVRNSCCLKRTQSMPAGEYKVLCRQKTRQIFRDASIVDQERERLGDEASPEQEEEEEEEETPVVVAPPRVSRGITREWLRTIFPNEKTEAWLGPLTFTNKVRTGNDILGWNQWKNVSNSDRPNYIQPATRSSWSVLDSPMWLKIYIKDNKLWATVETIHAGTPGRRDSRGQRDGWTRKTRCLPSSRSHAELTVGSNDEVVLGYVYQILRGNVWRANGSDDIDCKILEYGGRATDIQFTGRITPHGMNFKSKAIPFRTSQGNNGEYQAFIEGTW